MPTPLQTIRAYPAHPRTVCGLLESRRETLADRVFLEFEDRSWTFSTFAIEVERSAHVLLDNGVREGTRVAVMATNHDRFTILFFALARIGAVMVTINPQFGSEEAGYVLQHAEPQLVVCMSETLSVVHSACAARKLSPTLLRLSDGDRDIPALDALAAAIEPREPLPTSPAPDATCLIMYTSGTTGFPKGVMHSQRSFVLAGEAFVERMHLTRDDRVLCILPMFHINAVFYSLGGALAAGATLVLASRFSAGEFWRMVATRSVTQVNIIAAIGSILAQRPSTEFVPGHRLTKVYGAPVSKQIADVFKQRFQVPTVIEGYGMTEIPGACNQPFEGPHRYGSMGRPALHPDRSIEFAALKVVDEAGNPVADGEPGELLVRTPIVMQGYYRDREQTEAAFDRGWFRTGDRVRRDANGDYWFITRQKDIIRRRGENIAGAELDRVVGALPGVAEAAAVAVPSELGEDDILIAIVRDDDAELDAAAVARWCAQHLSAIKRPRYVVFVDALPHTPTHRVAKFRLSADPTLLERAVDLER